MDIVTKVNYFQFLYFYLVYIFQSDVILNTRRQKRRRLTASGQSEEYEQKRPVPSLLNHSRHPSVSSTPSVYLSSSEDERGASTHYQEINKDKTNIFETPVQHLLYQPQRKRHQRKPTRLSNGITQLQQKLNISVKNEPSTPDDNQSMARKKPEPVLTPRENPPNENYHWFRQALRSIVPSSDADSSIRQASSPQSRKKNLY